MNRFYKMREDFAEGIKHIFSINEEQLKTIEGVCLNFTLKEVELRDKNYATIAKIKLKHSVPETYNYYAIQYEVLGFKTFHDFLDKYNLKEEDISWMEIWSNGLVKVSYEMYVNLEGEPNNW